MAYADFNETQWVYVTDTATVTELGSLRTNNGPVEIEHIRLNFFKKGTEVGDEVFRLNIYSDPGYTNVFASSADFTLSTDIVPAMGTNWIGWIRFDFDSPIIGADNDFYVGLEPVTYTRVADTFYVGACADYYPTLNPKGLGIGAYMEIYERAVSDVCG